VHNNEDRVFAFSKNRNNDVELTPEVNDGLFMKTITGSIVFERDGSGKAIGAAATVFGRPDRLRKTN